MNNAKSMIATSLNLCPVKTHPDTPNTNWFIAMSMKDVIYPFLITATDSVEGYCSAEVPDVPETDLPVRWKAPECLTKHQLTTASDVWAFGVLVYEVLTYGCTPYRDILDKDVRDQVGCFSR